MFILNIIVYILMVIMYSGLTIVIGFSSVLIAMVYVYQHETIIALIMFGIGVYVQYKLNKEFFQMLGDIFKKETE